MDLYKKINAIYRGISKVAKQVGCHRNTVRRVLNGKPSKYADGIMEAAKVIIQQDHLLREQKKQRLLEKAETFKQRAEKI